MSDHKHEWLEEAFQNAPEPVPSVGLLVPILLWWIGGTIVGFILAFVAAPKSLDWTLNNWFHDAAHAHAEVPLVAIFASICVSSALLLFATAQMFRIRKTPVGIAAAGEDAGKAREARGALQVAHKVSHAIHTFITSEFKFAVGFVVVAAIAIVFSDYNKEGWKTAICFLVGVIISFIINHVSRTAGVDALAATIHGATQNATEGFKPAYNAASVIGATSVGLAYFGFVIVYLIFNDAKFVVGYVGGLTIVALFTRIGGAVFGHAASASFSHNNKEHTPSAIAILDAAGKQINNSLGVAADTAATFTGAILAAILIGHLPYGQEGLATPLYYAAISIGSFFIGQLIVRVSNDSDVAGSVTFNARGATLVGAIINIALAAIIAWTQKVAWHGYVSFILGVLGGFLITLLAELATSSERFTLAPVAGEARHGAAAALVRGITSGLGFVAPIVIVLFIVIILSILVGDDEPNRQANSEYCLALAAIGLVVNSAIQLTGQAYSAIANSAHAVRRMVNGGNELETLVDAGGQLASTNRVVSTAGAVLTTYALIRAFATTVLGKTLYLSDRHDFSIVNNGTAVMAGPDYVWRSTGQQIFYDMDPYFLIGFTMNILDKRSFTGLLLGAALPFAFSSFLVHGINSAKSVFDTCKEEFHDGQSADTAHSSFRHSLIPVLLGIAWPIIVGFGAGPVLLANMLFGATIVGLSYALFITFTGSQYENAATYAHRSKSGENSSGDAAPGALDAVSSVGSVLKDAIGHPIALLIKALVLTSLLILYAVHVSCDRTYIWDSYCYTNRP